MHLRRARLVRDDVAGVIGLIHELGLLVQCAAALPMLLHASRRSRFSGVHKVAWQRHETV